jgi:hypothetical protein
MFEHNILYNNEEHVTLYEKHSTSLTMIAYLHQVWKPIILCPTSRKEKTDFIKHSELYVNLCCGEQLWILFHYTHATSLLFAEPLVALIIVICVAELLDREQLHTKKNIRLSNLNSVSTNPRCILAIFLWISLISCNLLMDSWQKTAAKHRKSQWQARNILINWFFFFSFHRTEWNG